MKKGFILAEIVIALAIFSLLSVLLFSTFFQSNKIYNRVRSFVDLDHKAMVAYTFLKRDISGIFYPEYKPSGEPESKGEKTDGQEKKHDKPDKENKGVDQEKEDDLAGLIVDYDENQNIQSFSFISSNPLKIYAKLKKPHIVQITYSLKKENEEGQVFSLMRRESFKLDMDVKNVSDDSKENEEKDNIVEYTLVDGIKKINLHYGVFVRLKDAEEEPKDTDEKSKKANQKMIPMEYKNYDIWPPKEKDETIAQLPKLPHDIKMDIAFYDIEQENEKEYSFIFPIHASSLLTTTVNNEKAEEKSETKKNESEKEIKKEQPSGK